MKRLSTSMMWLLGGFIIVVCTFLAVVYHLNRDSGAIAWKQTSAADFGLLYPYFLGTDGTSLYIVGNQYLYASRHRPLRIEKRRADDGTYDPSFGTNGVYIGDKTSWSQTVSGALDAGNLYLVGSDYEAETDSSDCRWRIEKRNLATGDLVPEFGMNGVVISNPSSACEGAKAVAVDARYMYVGGSHMLPDKVDVEPGHGSDSQWRIEKRSLYDGSLVADFGDQGIVTEQLSSGHEGMTGLEWVTGIAVDGEYLYVIGKDYSAGLEDEQWRIEKRRLSDGGLADGFGDGGIVVSNPGPSFDEPRGISIDDAFMYIVGHEDLYTAPPLWRTQSVAGGTEIAMGGYQPKATGQPVDSEPPLPPTRTTNAQWRIEKRRLSDGTRVEGFGLYGVVSHDPSLGVDWAAAAAKSKRLPFWSRLVDRDSLLGRQALYVVGKDEQMGAPDQQWRIEKRNAADGRLITSFGEQGVLTYDPGGKSEMARAVIAGDAVYVMGEMSHINAAQYEWLIMKIKR